MSALNIWLGRYWEAKVSPIGRRARVGGSRCTAATRVRWAWGAPVDEPAGVLLCWVEGETGAAQATNVIRTPVAMASRRMSRHSIVHLPPASSGLVQDAAHLRNVVAAQRLHRVAKFHAANDLEERLQQRAFVVLSRNDEIIALFEEGHELELQRARRSQDAEADISGAAHDCGRHPQVGVLLALIPADV